jgi:hypothetical protein
MILAFHITLIIISKTFDKHFHIGRLVGCLTALQIKNLPKILHMSFIADHGL